LGASLIVAKIHTSKTRFDVSLNELLRLKKEKVADAVVEAMIRASQAEASSDTSMTDPHDPVSPHNPGIYYLNEADRQRQMIRLDPTVYSQTKEGGFLSRLKTSASYGIAKTKSRAVIAGAHARLHITQPRPVFYFYFEETSGRLSHTGGVFQSAPALSPNEFVLVKMESTKKNRELVVGQFNIYGAESGILEEDRQPLDYEPIAPGIFKVTPKSDLAAGEYGFQYAGTTPLPTYGWGGALGSQQVFDFGIQVEIKIQKK